jgi:hypothetical protein
MILLLYLPYWTSVVSFSCANSGDTRLWQRPATPTVRFSQVEKIPPPKCKQIVQILVAFPGSEKAAG